MKLLAFTLILVSCGSTNTKSSSGDTIVIKVAEKFDIKLVTNLGTGYSWFLADTSYQSYLSLDTSFVVANTAGKEDGQETQVFQFRGLSKGTTKLHFKHVRPWQKNEPAKKEETYAVTIH